MRKLGPPSAKFLVPGSISDDISRLKLRDQWKSSWLSLRGRAAKVDFGMGRDCRHSAFGACGGSRIFKAFVLSDHEAYREWQRKEWLQAVCMV